jgi:RNA polymerase sigma-70 factor (ECF subfamily)
MSATLLTMQLANAGDEAAWAVVFDAYYPRLYRLFRSRMARHDQAEDLASSEMLEAFRSVQGLPDASQDRPLEVWLFGIARTTLEAADRPGRALESRPSRFVRDEFIEGGMREALRPLSADQRTALELRFVIGLSTLEAAALMGRTPAALRALLSRGERAFQLASGEAERQWT